ncbi:putative mitochondrial chaperone protein DNAj [Leptomonas pyrrhocoris]|uniref:Putative mitochondrial chaperone protein DNAj n=1 Tax=Leptomonas pyrrhocoris TaxID=157538 RepID=A0A0M9FY50_LEPPY|nr:putative mitochondrial chaperone protein DNAj [Leptomonas pyrrhocoris]XP_015656924.1 putative mitochondrial chaperone protein DNAj [Leptomonas pyrrhocoris]KPA78484.1 putative mitochondrial chaperone protein DNAj [Leptomonas pyrrhocoris]KPA78485.1 putative mitochondrial chaperone protein DNAj [Leptomonas pyrrhocoris]|eukprot:XP_015656923.1 putative mitochondrial chaperone protein DNAj [Leptomonas pyrrhocoris]
MRASRLCLAGLRRLPLSVAAVATAGTLSSAAATALPLWSQARFASSSKNPYTVLGIKQGADKQAIKKAYRVLARKHHPDAPGGSDEKFREIQEAYEQIKSGVWIRKEQESSAGSGDGGSGNANRYSGFRYTTRTHHKSKVSYDQFYEELHTGKVKRDPFADDDEAEEPAAKDARRNPFALNEIAFQAWLRFIIAWCLLFSSLRLGLFMIFPPRWEKPQRKPPPRELRGQRRPAPKPIRASEDAIVA